MLWPAPFHETTGGENKKDITGTLTPHNGYKYTNATPFTHGTSYLGNSIYTLHEFSIASNRKTIVILSTQNTEMKFEQLYQSPSKDVTYVNHTDFTHFAFAK